jgi:hypothetical protein
MRKPSVNTSKDSTVKLDGNPHPKKLQHQEDLTQRFSFLALALQNATKANLPTEPPTQPESPNLPIAPEELPAPDTASRLTAAPQAAAQHRGDTSAGAPDMPPMNQLAQNHTEEPETRTGEALPTVDNATAQTATLAAPPPPQQSITFLVRGAGYSLHFHLPRTTTTALLKQGIQRRTRITTSRQILTVRGTLMDDEKTISTCNLRPGDTIDLSVIMNTAVTPSSARHTYDPRPTPTPATSFSANLSSGQKRTTSLSANLSTYPAAKQTSDTIQFFVKNLDGSSITMIDTFASTGEQLKARLEKKTNIPSSNQRLIYLPH